MHSRIQLIAAFRAFVKKNSEIALECHCQCVQEALLVVSYIRASVLLQALVLRRASSLAHVFQVGFVGMTMLVLDVCRHASV